MNNKAVKPFKSVDLKADNNYMDKIDAKLNELLNLNTALNVIFSLKMIDENDFLTSVAVLFKKLENVDNEIKLLLRGDDLQISIEEINIDDFQMPIKKLKFFD